MVPCRTPPSLPEYASRPWLLGRCSGTSSALDPGGSFETLQAQNAYPKSSTATVPSFSGACGSETMCTEPGGVALCLPDAVTC